MKLNCRYFYKLIALVAVVLLTNAPTYAQQPAGGTGQRTIPDDPVLKKDPKLIIPKGAYIPSAVRIGGDLAGLVGSAIFPSNRAEIQADIDFYRFYAVGEFGISNYAIQTGDINYSNTGSFYRIGVDIDFLKTDNDYNIAYIGFRYAKATFSDQLQFEQPQAHFPTVQFDGRNRLVNADWNEIIVGVKGKVLTNVYMGYAFRFMIRHDVPSGLNFRPYQTPGFGLSQFDSRWLFHYYVYYRLPFRSKVVPDPTKKR
jgi:hypothetical protein